jgi:PAS domain S-box-containing protein
LGIAAARRKIRAVADEELNLVAGTPDAPVAERYERLLTIYELTDAVSRASGLPQVYEAALDALERAVGADRASILLFDPDGVMRFKAWRRLSETYRRATEGHSPWSPGATDAEPILMPDVALERSLDALRSTILEEGIRALAFIPLVTQRRVIGKFMVYREAPHRFEIDEVRTVQVIAGHVAFGIERKRAEEALAQREREMQTLIDHVPDIIARVDRETRHMFVNRAVERAAGLPAQAFLGRTHQELGMPPDLSAFWREHIWRVFETGEQQDVEFEFPTPSGPRAFLSRMVPERGPDGTIQTVLAITRDVTERRQAEQDRLRLLEREQEALAASERANRAKDEFLTMLSHELRTPLNAILGWTQLLRTSLRDPKMATRALDTIERNARVQAQLIEDLLDLSRISRGQLRLDQHRVALGTIIESARDAVRLAADRQNVTIDVSADPTAIVWGDPARLQQVVWNLLSNAIRFSPEGGCVTVRASCTGEEAVLSVSDTGQGIEPAFLPYVFDRFRQADAPNSRLHCGLGLGLSIVRHLVEMHGGSVAATSEGPGRGATFTARLPLVDARPGTDAPGGTAAASMKDRRAADVV